MGASAASPFGEPHPARGRRRSSLLLDALCRRTAGAAGLGRLVGCDGGFLLLERLGRSRLCDRLGLHGGAARAAGLRRRGGAASAAGASSPATAAALRVRVVLRAGFAGASLRSFACSGRYLLGDGIDGRALGARALASGFASAAGSAEAAAGVASAGID